MNGASRQRDQAAVCVAGQLRPTHYFTSVIDSGTDVEHTAAQAAEVSGRAVFPEHGVRPNFEWKKWSVRARTGRADHLAFVVDPKSESDGIAAERTEFLDLALPWPPYRRFKIEDLRQRAAWVPSAILCKPDYLASIVESKSLAIISAEGGKRHHGPIFPNGPEAYKVSAETTKVFPQRIGQRSLSRNRQLVPPVRSARNAV